MGLVVGLVRVAHGEKAVNLTVDARQGSSFLERPLRERLVVPRFAV